MICPTCNGSGNCGPVHYNTGINKKTGMCSGYWKQESECFRCSSTGVVPDEMAQWIIEGKALRKVRVDSGESLYDAAKRIGVETAELSAIEQGRKPASGNF